MTASNPEREAVAAFAARMRHALDAVALARPPVEVWQQATELARAIADVMAPHRVDDPADRIVGSLREYPGRGQNLVPAMRKLVESDTDVEAEVVLDHTHLGSGGAHGGIPPLMFDELLGQLANRGASHVVRTAYLRVDYRSLTPVGTPLRMRGRVVEVTGRKRLLRGSAEAGGRVLAQVEGLFVEERPRLTERAP